jgi:hypothetical protein
MPLTKFTSNTDIIQALADLPNDTGGLTAAQLKAKFDEVGGLLKAYLNNTLIAELEATTDGTSGADKIGMTPITETGTASTIQAIVETLISKLKAVTDNASGADFIKATGISGLTGDSVQLLLEALKSYIDTHKTSADHDGRYFTETEIQSTTDTSSGADKVGATPVATGSGNTVQVILEWLYQELVNVTLGQIPNDSLTNIKLDPDIKVGSLANLTTTAKSNVVGAINEVDADLSTHTTSTTNPHSVTASQVGAYTKAEVDAEVGYALSLAIAGI